MVAFFTKLFEQTDGTFALDVQQVIEDDTGAVVICAATATATRDGRALAWRAAHLWRIEEQNVLRNSSSGTATAAPWFSAASFP